MATVNIKRIVGKAIADYIAANVTGLSGRVSEVLDGPEQAMVFPSATVLPDALTYEPQQADEVYWRTDIDDGKIVLNVGDFAGTYELRLYTKTRPERELYEQRILDLFLSTQDAPGTIYVNTPTLTVGGYVSLYSAQIQVRLDSEQWREEFAFENRRYVFIDLDIAFPALVSRNAPTMESLRVALTNALDSNVPDEVVEVQLDGSTLPST